MNKKIVFKIPEFPHITETFILSQVIRAIDLGYDVDLVVRRILPQTEWINSNYLEKYNLLSRVTVENYKIPENYFYRITAWLFLLVKNIYRVSNIFKFYLLKNKLSLTWLFEYQFYMKFNDANLIHIQYGTNKYPFDTLKEAGFNPKIICSFHGHDAFFPINGYIENNGYYNRLFNNADFIIANTDYLKHALIDLGCNKDKINTIPVSVDTEVFYPMNLRKNSNVFKLITVGRLHPAKGHLKMLEVFHHLLKDGINAELLIVGDGIERDKIENYINYLGLSNSVFLKGYCSQVEVAKLLNKSDLFLFTPLANYNQKSTETQGLAISEAMACGLPVISFDNGGVRYTFEDGISGFLVRENHIEEMSKKIRRLLNDEILLNNMSKAALEFVRKNYSKFIIDNQWEKFYDELLD